MLIIVQFKRLNEKERQRKEPGQQQIDGGAQMYIVCIYYFNIIWVSKFLSHIFLSIYFSFNFIWNALTTAIDNSFLNFFFAAIFHNIEFVQLFAATALQQANVFDLLSSSTVSPSLFNLKWSIFSDENHNRIKYQSEILKEF